MEGRASTFEKVLADFEARLAKAEFVAIDTELTGVDIEGEVDTFEESAAARVEKICRVAERYSLIQIGLTLVGRVENGHGLDGPLWCASYNLFAFPHASPELARDPVFMCQTSALRFNAQHKVDFNTWIGEGIPYMSREDERQLKASGVKDEDLKQKVGLLRLWKSLCSARLPFVVHCPLDLFFLLVAFERRPLPRGDPRALAILIRQCTPKVYDTAHLHGAVGRFRRLGLTKFFEDAKVRHEELIRADNSVVPVEFELQGETAVRYSRPAEQMAHEAGYDSLMTAQLFVYLRAISPTRIREAANRLFLFRSIEFIDIDRAALEDVLGYPMFDLSRVTLLVAALDPDDSGLANEAARCIAATGAEYKWMDAAHILVVLRASGGTAIRKAAELAGKVHGVESWMPFEQWRDMQVQEAEAAKAKRRANGNQVAPMKSLDAPHPSVGAAAHSAINGSSGGSTNGSASSTRASGSTSRTSSTSPGYSSSSTTPSVISPAQKSSAIVGVPSECVERQRWVLFLRAIGVTGLLALLALVRLRQRLRRR